MSIISISRGSFSRGKEVAEKLARALNYECISREILLEASAEFNVPEIKLMRAIHDAPSILQRFTVRTMAYVAYIQAALLEHVQRDNVVYHGLAGHFFLQNISHVLKVRIIADFEDRVRAEMEREKTSAAVARGVLVRDDEQRRKWALSLYNKDTSDVSLYDMVLHIKNMRVDDAVAVILTAARQPCYRTSPESQRKLDDLALAAHARAALIEDFGQTNVSVQDGVVTVRLTGLPFMERELSARVQDILGGLPGVRQVNVSLALKRSPNG